MSAKTEWENEDWLQSASRLLQWTSVADLDKPLMLLVRHSHRETIHNHNEMMSGGLTPLGTEMATEMGRRLPTNRQIHFFFSFIPRCYETALAISEGFRQEGGEVIDLDPSPSLVGPQVIDREVWKELQPDGKNVTSFVNCWVDGVYEGKIEPFEEYKDRLFKDTVGKLASLDGGLMHVHITHDLAMMSSKRILLERPLVNEDREPYLGGLGVAATDDGNQLFLAGATYTI
ncbi:MAG: hypothetical protein ACXADL_15880 [Candidatus Thorarchaeota archaeon]